MQLTMSYVQDMTRAPQSNFRDTSSKPDMTRFHPRKTGQKPPKSYPLDADDLRRRLYVVIAEREAKNEWRHRGRVDALAAKDAQVQREKAVRQQQCSGYLAAAAASSTTTATAVSAQTAVQTAAISKPPKAKQSLQGKLRHKHSKTAVARSEHPEPFTTDVNGNRQYIPQSAASQFARTTTSIDNRAAHELSTAALRFHNPGISQEDRQALDRSTITPAKQRGLLHRINKQRDLIHERNQFQDPSTFEKMMSEEGGNTTQSKRHWNRSIAASGGDNNGTQLNKAIEAMILDDHGADMRSLADLNNGRYVETVYTERQSSDTLADMSTAMEHRIDWSQSDEMLPHERRGAGLKSHPLLRKTSSLWTLKSRLGGHRTGGMERTRSGVENKLGIVAEEFDGTNVGEQAVAEINIDDGSTPMSPHSGVSKSGGFKLFRKLRI